MTRIYTRSGDKGETGLANGTRIAKTERRIEALGHIDLLNSEIGILRSLLSDRAFDQTLQDIQSRLFDLGALVALADVRHSFDSHVSRLETSIDQLGSELPPLKQFILPGGSAAAAQCHRARAVCRTVELDLFQLDEESCLTPALLQYINRLSDFLFVMARAINLRAGHEEVTWTDEG